MPDKSKDNPHSFPDHPVQKGPSDILSKSEHKNPPSRERCRKKWLGKTKSRLRKDKRHKYLQECMKFELHEMVEVKAGGKKRKLSKVKVAAKNIVNGAIRGDKAMLEMVWKVEKERQIREEKDQPPPMHGGVFLFRAPMHSASQEEIATEMHMRGSKGGPAWSEEEIGEYERELIEFVRNSYTKRGATPPDQLLRLLAG